MQTLKLKNNISLSFLRSGKSLGEYNFENVPNSLIPGEWIFIQNPNRVTYIGFINTRTEQKTICYPLQVVSREELKDIDNDTLSKMIISDRINKAYQFRKSLYNDIEDFRLFFGFNDGLPGLIIDKYSNSVLVQITTAGVDRFRDYLVEVIKRLINLDVLIIDKEPARKKECLPKYHNIINIDEVKVSESGFHYVIPISMIQKNGFYFDHRENRIKLESFLKTGKIVKNTGIDLFCYMGSWGMHLLRSGVKHVTFVDQGDYESILKKTVSTSCLGNSYDFIRDDVFSYLDKLSIEKKKFDIVVSDPPAFSKSSKNLKNAIKGYRKLYKKIFPILNKQSVLVVASCTHGVTLDDLAKIIEDTSEKYKKTCSLLDIGTQGFDHHINGFESKGYYLKYLLYWIEDYKEDNNYEH